VHFYGLTRRTLLPLLIFALCGCATVFGNTAEVDHPVREHRFERYLERIQPLLARYGYGIVAAAVFAEGTGIPLPGQTLLVAGALEASHGKLNITWLLFFVAAAATIGNTIGYAIGRWGHTILEKFKITPARLQHFEKSFQQYGGLVIVLGRFLDGFRQLNGIVAGLMGMPWRSFIFYNIAGAILWTYVWGLGAYYLGRDIHKVTAVFHRHRWLLYGITAAIVVSVFAWLLRSTKVEKPERNGPEAGVEKE
jgi:membrane protein DedA with SNARE-associated domain